MTKQTHVAFGLLTSLAMMQLTSDLSMQEVVYGSLAAVIASPLPDYDLLDNRANNTAQELVETMKNCLPMLGLYLLIRYKLGGSFPEKEVILLQAFCWFNYLHFTVVAPHRDWSHSILWGIIGTLLFRWMIPELRLCVWFWYGYASHLAIDMMNKVGERIFFPSKTRICVKLCKADGFMNNLIFIASAAGYLYLVWVMQEGI